MTDTQAFIEIVEDDSGDDMIITISKNDPEIIEDTDFDITDGRFEVIEEEDCEENGDQSNLAQLSLESSKNISSIQQNCDSVSNAVTTSEETPSKGLTSGEQSENGIVEIKEEPEELAEYLPQVCSNNDDDVDNSDKFEVVEESPNSGKCKVNSGLYLCKQCDFLATSRKQLRLHVSRTHSNVSKCHFCGKELSSSLSLQRHVRDVHRRRRDPIECLLCHSILKRKSYIYRHLKSKHDKFGKSLEEGVDFRYIVRTKAAKKITAEYHSTINCLHCDAVYTERKALNHHLKSVHKKMLRTLKKDVDYKCVPWSTFTLLLRCLDCRYLFKSDSALEEHVQKEHEINVRLKQGKHYEYIQLFMEPEVDNPRGPSPKGDCLDILTSVGLQKKSNGTRKTSKHSSLENEHKPSRREAPLKESSDNANNIDSQKLYEASDRQLRKEGSIFAKACSRTQKVTDIESVVQKDRTDSAVKLNPEFKSAEELVQLLSEDPNSVDVTDESKTSQTLPQSDDKISLEQNTENCEWLKKNRGPIIQQNVVLVDPNSDILSPLKQNHLGIVSKVSDDLLQSNTEVEKEIPSEDLTSEISSAKSHLDVTPESKNFQTSQNVDPDFGNCEKLKMNNSPIKRKKACLGKSKPHSLNMPEQKVVGMISEINDCPAGGITKEREDIPKEDLTSEILSRKSHSVDASLESKSSQMFTQNDDIHLIKRKKARLGKNKSQSLEPLEQEVVGTLSEVNHCLLWINTDEDEDIPQDDLRSGVSSRKSHSLDVSLESKSSQMLTRNDNINLENCEKFEKNNSPIKQKKARLEKSNSRCLNLSEQKVVEMINEVNDFSAQGIAKECEDVPKEDLTSEIPSRKSHSVDANLESKSSKMSIQNDDIHFENCDKLEKNNSPIKRKKARLEKSDSHSPNLPEQKVFGMLSEVNDCLPRGNTKEHKDISKEDLTSEIPSRKSHFVDANLESKSSKMLTQNDDVHFENCEKLEKNHSPIKRKKARLGKSKSPLNMPEQKVVKMLSEVNDYSARGITKEREDIPKENVISEIPSRKSNFVDSNLESETSQMLKPDDDIHFENCEKLEQNNPPIKRKKARSEKSKSRSLKLPEQKAVGMVSEVNDCLLQGNTKEYEEIPREDLTSEISSRKSHSVDASIESKSSQMFPQNGKVHFENDNSLKGNSVPVKEKKTISKTSNSRSSSSQKQNEFGTISKLNGSLFQKNIEIQKEIPPEDLISKIPSRKLHSVDLSPKSKSSQRFPQHDDPNFENRNKWKKNSSPMKRTKALPGKSTSHSCNPPEQKVSQMTTEVNDCLLQGYNKDQKAIPSEDPISEIPSRKSHAVNASLESKSSQMLPQNEHVCSENGNNLKNTVPVKQKKPLPETSNARSSNLQKQNEFGTISNTKDPSFQKHIEVPKEIPSEDLISKIPSRKLHSVDLSPKSKSSQRFPQHDDPNFENRNKWKKNSSPMKRTKALPIKSTSHSCNPPEQNVSQMTTEVNDYLLQGYNKDQEAIPPEDLISEIPSRKSQVVNASLGSKSSQMFPQNDGNNLKNTVPVKQKKPLPETSNARSSNLQKQNEFGTISNTKDPSFQKHIEVPKEIPSEDLISKIPSRKPELVGLGLESKNSQILSQNDDAIRKKWKKNNSPMKRKNALPGKSNSHSCNLPEPKVFGVLSEGNDCLCQENTKGREAIPSEAIISEIPSSKSHSVDESIESKGSQMIPQNDNVYFENSNNLKEKNVPVKQKQACSKISNSGSLSSQTQNEFGTISETIRPSFQNNIQVQKEIPSEDLTSKIPLRKAELVSMNLESKNSQTFPQNDEPNLENSKKLKKNNSPVKRTKALPGKSNSHSCNPPEQKVFGMIHEANDDCLLFGYTKDQKAFPPEIPSRKSHSVSASRESKISQMSPRNDDGYFENRNNLKKNNVPVGMKKVLLESPNSRSFSLQKQNEFGTISETTGSSFQKNIEVQKEIPLKDLTLKIPSRKPHLINMSLESKHFQTLPQNVDPNFKNSKKSKKNNSKMKRKKTAPGKSNSRPRNPPKQRYSGIVSEESDYSLQRNTKVRREIPLAEVISEIPLRKPHNVDDNLESERSQTFPQNDDLHFENCNTSKENIVPIQQKKVLSETSNSPNLNSQKQNEFGTVNKLNGSLLQENNCSLLQENNGFLLQENIEVQKEVPSVEIQKEVPSVEIQKEVPFEEWLSEILSEKPHLPDISLESETSQTFSQNDNPNSKNGKNLKKNALKVKQRKASSRKLNTDSLNPQEQKVSGVISEVNEGNTKEQKEILSEDITSENPARKSHPVHASLESISSQSFPQNDSVNFEMYNKSKKNFVPLKQKRALPETLKWYGSSSQKQNEFGTISRSKQNVEVQKEEDWLSEIPLRKPYSVNVSLESRNSQTCSQNDDLSFENCKNSKKNNSPIKQKKTHPGKLNTHPVNPQQRKDLELISEVNDCLLRKSTEEILSKDLILEIPVRKSHSVNLNLEKMDSQMFQQNDRLNFENSKMKDNIPAIQNKTLPDESKSHSPQKLNFPEITSKSNDKLNFENSKMKDNTPTIQNTTLPDKSKSHSPQKLNVPGIISESNGRLNFENSKMKDTIPTIQNTTLRDKSKSHSPQKLNVPGIISESNGISPQKNEGERKEMPPKTPNIRLVILSDQKRATLKALWEDERVLSEEPVKDSINSPMKHLEKETLVKTSNTGSSLKLLKRTSSEANLQNTNETDSCSPPKKRLVSSDVSPKLPIIDTTSSQNLQENEVVSFLGKNHSASPRNTYDSEETRDCSDISFQESVQVQEQTRLNANQVSLERSEIKSSSLDQNCFHPALVNLFPTAVPRIQKHVSREKWDVKVERLEDQTIIIISPQSSEHTECVFEPVNTRQLSIKNSGPKVENIKQIGGNENKFRCKYCSFRSTAYNACLRHIIRSDHEITPVYICPYCEKFMGYYQYALRAHFKAKHPDDHRTLYCSNCPFDTVTYQRWHQHMKNHFKDIPKRALMCYICRHCLYKTLFRMKLIKHTQAEHENNQRIKKCVFCYFYGDAKDVRKHLKYAHHTYCEVFNCSFCSYKVDLLMKLKGCSMENQDVLIICSYCDNEYTSQKALEAHMTSSHKDKCQTFICYQCDFEASDETSFVAHLKNVHDNSGRFYCCHCRFKTNSKQQLADHIAFDHGRRGKYIPVVENIFQDHTCPYCSFRSKRARCMLRHLEESHRTLDLERHSKLRARRLTKNKDEFASETYDEGKNDGFAEDEEKKKTCFVVKLTPGGKITSSYFA